MELIISPEVQSLYQEVQINISALIINLKYYFYLMIDLIYNVYHITDIFLKITHEFFDDNPTPRTIVLMTILVSYAYCIDFWFPEIRRNLCDRHQEMVCGIYCFLDDYIEEQIQRLTCYKKNFRTFAYKRVGK